MSGAIRVPWRPHHRMVLSRRNGLGHHLWHAVRSAQHPVPSLRSGDTGTVQTNAGERSTVWWAVTDSNRRPTGCKPVALPTELTAPDQLNGSAFNRMPFHTTRTQWNHATRILTVQGYAIPSPTEQSCEIKSLTGKTPKSVPPITDWLLALLDTPTQVDVDMLW